LIVVKGGEEEAEIVEDDRERKKCAISKEHVLMK
jgi:hypothetical protein